MTVAKQGKRVSAETSAIIDSARKCAEGRAVRFEIQTADDVQQALAVAAAKMST